MLDPELAAALPPLLPRRTSSRAEAASPGSAERARRAVRDDLFEGLLDSDSDSDEDWRADLERARKLQVGRRGQGEGPSGCLPACLHMCKDSVG